MDLMDSINIAGSGMRAQGERLRIVSENIANADSGATKPGEDPYRRKTISFKDTLNRELGYNTVKVNETGTDKTDFIKKYDPTHPAADEDGFVSMPNVNIMVEMVDMREAQRGYEANLNMIEASKAMLQQTIALIR